MRTALFSDDPFARGALRRILQDLGLSVSDASAGLDAALDAEADAVLWDLGLAEPGALPDLGLPVLALAADDERARLALSLGAEGVIFRELDGQRISAALDAVLAGLRVLDPAFNALLPRRESELPEALTRRERQTLEAMAQGLSNRGIARQLGVSEHTVKFHVNSVLEKLNARNRTDAVVRGFRLGVLVV